MKTRTVVFAAMCSLGIMLQAQQRPASIIPLRAIEKGEKAASNPLVTTSAMCDDLGNIYSRPFDMDGTFGPKYSQAPVQKITPEAKLADSFLVTDLPGGQTRTFFVRNRRVYVPTTSEKGELYVAELGPSGSVSSEIKLQVNKRIDVWHLAVFQSGEYLVVGTSAMIGTESHTPFAAVFAADGRVVKTIYEPEDEDARQKAGAGDPKYAMSNAGNLFVMFDADVAIGSDNNAYLLHGTSPALVYAIAPSGEIVRKLKFSGADPELKATSIKPFGGRLAIGFNRAGNVAKNLIKVIDLEGNPIASYEILGPEGESDNILACYGQNGFTLIPRLGGAKPYVLTAKLP